MKSDKTGMDKAIMNEVPIGCSGRLWKGSLDEVGLDELGMDKMAIWTKWQSGVIGFSDEKNIRLTCFLYQELVEKIVFCRSVGNIIRSLVVPCPMLFRFLPMYICLSTSSEFNSFIIMGKSRNRKTFPKIENLRFLQNYDKYNCIFGIKLKGLSLSFIWRVMQWN